MAANVVICVARQFGSGGHEIGQALAQAMGISFYDKELLRDAADKSGIHQELFEKNDEKPTSSLLYATSAMDGRSKATSFSDYLGYAPSERMQSVLAEVIRDAADKGPCVIIGRSADYVLRGHPGMLSVFVWAELEMRVGRIQRLHNLDEDAARSLVRKTDRNRANYYRFTTDRDWGLAENYDVCLDAGRLGTAPSVQLLQRAAELFCSEG